MVVAAYEFFAVLLIRLLVGYVAKHRPTLSPYATALSISLFLTIGKKNLLLSMTTKMTCV